MSRMEKPISRLMSPYLGKRTRLLQAPISESPMKPPLQETQTGNLLIQDFVVFGVRELLQLQRVLSDESHRQMKIVVPQL